MHLVSLAVATLGVAVCASAQQPTLTAHPQETLTGGAGNYSPFGVFSTGSGAEARTQLLVPADELPGPGTALVGIELTALVGGTVDYQSLQITAAPTTATSLASSFAANLTGTQTVVLQATGLAVAYSTTAWVRIDFTQPYVHDGQSALVLDIKKVAQPVGGSFQFVSIRKNSQPVRVDRPRMVYAFGNPGSGASNATAAFADDDAIGFRLVWLGTPTVRNRSDTGASGNQYNVGGSVLLTVQGDPGFLWVLAAATGFLQPGLVVPGLSGTFRLNGPVPFASGLLDPTGIGTATVAIPNTPSLAGSYLVYQGATVDPATGAIALTNGTDHFVNP